MKNIIPWFQALRRNPRQMGTVFPATRMLAEALAATALRGRSERFVIEVGAGSGSVTDSLVRAAAGRVKIRAVEPNRLLAAGLRKRLPEVEVFSGTFEQRCADLFAGVDHAIVVSSVPLFSLGDTNRAAYFESLSGAIADDCVSRYVQYTYWPRLPWLLGREICGTEPRLVASNCPPAWVWCQDHSGIAWRNRRTDVRVGGDRRQQASAQLT